MSIFTHRTRPVATIAAAALCFWLMACSDGGGNGEGDDVSTPGPTPGPTNVAFDVSQCLGQTVPGTNGRTVADLVIPDVLRIDPSFPSGFPNGRKLADPVIDITLAALFLDLDAGGQSALTFANIPLNPPANDVAFRANFPFLAPPQGSPPIAGGGGTSFDFRTESASQYIRVDRMGFPAVATALVPSSSKTAFNDANPQADANGQFVDELTDSLAALTEGIGDDLLGVDLDVCAD